MRKALQRAVGSLMPGSGLGAANCADRLKISRLARLDSKLARSRAKLDRLDRPLLEALLSLLLRSTEAARGEDAPVAGESRLLTSVTARNGDHCPGLP